MIDAMWRTDMSSQTTALATITALVLFSGTIDAQWVKHPTPGIPRLANGKPDLSAPSPRSADGHPDLSGFWGTATGGYFSDPAMGLKPGEVQLTPWAAAIRKMRMDRNHVDDPYGYCLPLGVPRINFRSPFKIVQTPQLTVFLHETYSGNTFRQVFTDGRPLPNWRDAEPTWLGYSIGRWDGDTFVVDTTGFRDRGWLNNTGAYPHSDALHVTERFRRADLGHMELTITIDDPKAYVKPWTNKMALLLQADTEILEAFCDNQMTILSHWKIDPPPVEPPSPRD